MTAATSLADITAVILAGGLGTRLRPVVADRPKVLADVAGRPFVTYLLDRLGAAGIGRVVICTGFRGDQLRSRLGGRFGGLELLYSHEPEPLGTGGAVRLAAPLLHSDPVLVLNGDSFCDADLPAFFSGHVSMTAEGSILLVHRVDTSRYGGVRIDADGRVVNFVEKGDTPQAGWVNAGVYLLGQRLLTTIGGNRPVSLEREVFPAWVGRGLFGCRCDGRFIDIGTPESYAAAAAFFAAEAGR